LKLNKLNQLLDPSTSLGTGDDEIIKGTWELDDNHELSYKSDGLDEEIKLKGSLIAAEPDALVFSVTKKQKDQKIVTSLYKLTGCWKLNSENKITFEVEKGKSKTDTLTFTGTWEVGKNFEIIYSYEQKQLKTKTKEIQTLTFKGYWDISEKNRLTYYFSEDSESNFKFKGTFQTTSILAKKGEIRYQVGVEVSGKRQIQDIVLFGTWKFSNKLEISFEIEYSDGTRSITFGGEYDLDEDKHISIALKTDEGKPLGVELILTKDFFGKDGQGFIRLSKTLEESRVETGMRFAW